MKDEALKLALEFFETMQRYKGVRSNIFIKFEPTSTGDYVDLREFDEKAKPIITTIKQALAATVQEPVGYITQARCFVHLHECTEAEAKLYGWKALYTTPPAQLAPVQEEDLYDLAVKADNEGQP